MLRKVVHSLSLALLGAVSSIFSWVVVKVQLEMRLSISCSTIFVGEYRAMNAI